MKKLRLKADDYWYKPRIIDKADILGNRREHLIKKASHAHKKGYEKTEWNWQVKIHPWLIVLENGGKTNNES